jgi:hypothetical protein
MHSAVTTPSVRVTGCNFSGIHSIFFWKNYSKDSFGLVPIQKSSGLLPPVTLLRLHLPQGPNTPRRSKAAAQACVGQGRARPRRAPPVVAKSVGPSLVLAGFDTNRPESGAGWFITDRGLFVISHVP